MTENKAGVGVQGNDIMILFPKSRLSKADAINMAAWIVALTDKEQFEEELNEVENI